MGAIQRMADYFGLLKSDIIEETGIASPTWSPGAAPGHTPTSESQRIAALYDLADDRDKTLVNTILEPYATKKHRPQTTADVAETLATLPTIARTPKHPPDG